MTRSFTARQAIAKQSAERGLYAAGLTVRDIRAHLEEVYGLKVSPDLPLIAASGDCRAMDQSGHRCRSG